MADGSGNAAENETEMNQDIDKLQRQLDSELAALAGALDVGPSAASLVKARRAIRMALDETILEQVEHPQASAGLLEQIRRSVRAALRRTPGDTPIRRITDGPGQRFWSPVAAAAMILLSVGLIHYAGRSRQPTHMIESVSVDTFVRASARVLADDPFHRDVWTELESIEAAVESASQANLSEEDELLQLGNDIEELLDELDLPDSMTRGPGHSGAQA